MEEHQDLLQTMHDRATARGYDVTAKNYRFKLEEGAHRMELLRNVLGLGRAPSAGL